MDDVNMLTNYRLVDRAGVFVSDLIMEILWNSKKGLK